MSDFGKLLFDTDMFDGPDDDLLDRFDANDDPSIEENERAYEKNKRLFGTYSRPVGWRRERVYGECD